MGGGGGVGVGGSRTRILEALRLSVIITVHAGEMTLYRDYWRWPIKRVKTSCTMSNRSSFRLHLWKLNTMHFKSLLMAIKMNI